MKIFDLNTDKCTGKICSDHCFSIFGLKRGANLLKPKTWGTDAVVVDGWSGSVLPAKEALQEFKQTFGFDPYKYRLGIKSDDHIDIYGYLKKQAEAFRII